MENVCRGKVTKITFPREGEKFSSGGKKLRHLLLAAVDDVDARCRKRACPYIFPIERFAQAEARGDGTHNGDERIEDGNLAHRIAAEQLVVKGKSPSGDADERKQDEHTLPSDVGQGTSERQPGNDEQYAAQEEAESCANKNVNALAQTARQQSGNSGTKGVKDNHSIAQERELSAGFATKVQRHYSGKSQYASQGFSQRKAVALKKHAGQDYQQEDAHGIQDGGPCPFAVGETEIEEGIVERGVDQGKEQDVPPVAALSDREWAVGGLGKGEDDESGHAETDAGKECLASGHVGLYAELAKA